MKRVELFYDVISPFSWIGFEVLCRYRTVWNMNLQLNPFLLGGVQKQAGRRNFQISPEKIKYHYGDLMRTGKHFKIPLKIPKDLKQTLFVKGSLSAMRVLTAVKASHPDRLEDVSRHLWLRVWSRDEDIAGSEGLMAALMKTGFDDSTAESLLVDSRSLTTKETLKQTTQAALEFGAFGSPTVVAHVNGRTEMLFGSDRMYLLADVLGEVYEGPMTHLSKL